jgi:hypothetical protein
MANHDKINLPAWYKTEKETGKTISKLVDRKELEFYLKNPDPFVRRLAILRVGQLKQKDSYILLNGILEDKLESEENRQLAALLMQKLNHELNLGFFISNSYLSRYSGEEDIDKLLDIAVIDTFPDYSFHFENDLIESQLNFDNEFLKSNLDEKADEFPFSYKEWLRHCSARLVPDIKKGFKNLGSWIAAFPERYKAGRQSRKEARIKSSEERAFAPSFRESRSSSYKRPRVYRYHPPLGSVMKSAFHKFLNILLFPFRLVYHFKWAILAVMVILYCILSFTEPGKLYLFRTNPQIYYRNTNFLKETKITVIKLINKSDALAAVLGTSTAVPPEETANTEETHNELKVTAPKGLYLRSEPLSSAKKLVLMKEGALVEFLNEEKKDSSGVKWIKIRTKDGATGWANAEWLGEVL